MRGCYFINENKLLKAHNNMSALFTIQMPTYSMHYVKKGKKLEMISENAFMRKAKRKLCKVLIKMKLNCFLIDVRILKENAWNEQICVFIYCYGFRTVRWCKLEVYMYIRVLNRKIIRASNTKHPHAPFY